MTYGHVMEFIDGEQGETVNISVEENPPESLRTLVSGNQWCLQYAVYVMLTPFRSIIRCLQ